MSCLPRPSFPRFRRKCIHLFMSAAVEIIPPAGPRVTMHLFNNNHSAGGLQISVMHRSLPYGSVSAKFVVSRPLHTNARLHIHAPIRLHDYVSGHMCSHLGTDRIVEMEGGGRIFYLGWGVGRRGGVEIFL